MSGLDRETTSVGSPVPASGRNAAIVQAMATAAATDNPTTSIPMSNRCPQPMTSDAARPMIGPISGAINMAPTTTEVESCSSPRAATTTERLISTENRRSDGGVGYSMSESIAARRSSADSRRRRNPRRGGSVGV